jgi:hypothetical protein
MAGSTSREMPARLPIQATVASKCSQYVSARAQEGGVVSMGKDVNLSDSYSKAVRVRDTA